MKKISPSHLILLAGVVVVLAWSAWQPYDRLTWWLEVLPALAALVVLFATYRRFEFTTLTYTLIALHMCVLFVGGHYTYARVPLFDWLRPIFGWHRNHYDRLGHIIQGFVPAIVTREVFVRLHVLKRPSWQPFLVVCVCLAISALYELIEWWTALLSGDAAISFLGTQGDPWDTQGDMFCALLGAIAALVLLSRVQDRAINRLTAPTSS
jgi:putative membrane protein